MWNKLSLRIKITILTAITLAIICALLTFISVSNAGDIFFYSYDPTDQGNTMFENRESLPVKRDTDTMFWKLQNKFKAQSILYTIGIVIVGTALSYFIIGKSLKPIKGLADRIEEIDENNLNAQLAFSSNGDEVSRLTKSFNNMLVKLDKAFVSKKLFAANAAHELKTPLTTILTNIEVMQMEEKPNIHDYEEVTAITKENVERLTALIRDLLYFNTGPDEAQYEHIQTAPLFEKILTELDGYIRQKQITVINTGNISIKGEKSLIERAFFNIIQNAVKYNKENGEIKIVACENRIIVEDSGIGIPKECIPQVFDPFYCVDKSRSRKLGGSGLGLSIAKQIFDKHSIQLNISSEPGKGTKVIVEI